MHIEHNLTAVCINPELGQFLSQDAAVKKMNLKEFRNKFNAKLIMKWTDLKPGPYLAETIEEFYAHVKITYKLDFYDYLSSKTPSEVRFDFMDYYDPFKSVFN